MQVFFFFYIIYVVEVCRQVIESLDVALSLFAIVVERVSRLDVEKGKNAHLVW